MAKNKNKMKNYDPQVLLEVEGANQDVSEATKYFKAMANLPQGNTSYRQNIAYRGQDADKYGALLNDCLTPKEAICLSQLVYHSYGLVRHALDTMAEFTVSTVDFHTTKNKKASREAMLGWSEAVGLKTFLDQVALEYYRSGNVYIYRFETRIKDSAVRDLSQLLGTKGSVTIPTSYTILDPKLVNFVGSGMLSTNRYQVVIPASEVQLIVQKYSNNPAGLNSLPTEFKNAISGYLGVSKSKGNTDLIVELNPDNLIVLYRKKQPYEAYAWPFLAGTFNDLEFRQELRNMDKALSRVIAKILIHVAVGDKDHIPSQSALDAIRAKISNSSTSTYLVTDGLVKIDQYYPDVAQMLDPKKYDAVRADIITALGISSAAYGDGSGSFSNNFLGIKILVERIKDGRNKILQEFLIPESKRVARAFNLKAEIIPEIIGVDLNDEKEWAKIYTRLYEDGAFSAQSVIEAIRDQRVPTYEEELQRQEEFIDLKKQGYFESNVNRGGDSQDSGRPEGPSTTPQTKPTNNAPNGANATVLRMFSKEEMSKSMDLALDFFKQEKGIGEFSDSQAKLVEQACAEFLVSQEFNREKLTEFLKKTLS